MSTEPGHHYWVHKEFACQAVHLVQVGSTYLEDPSNAGAVEPCLGFLAAEILEGRAYPFLDWAFPSCCRCSLKMKD